MHKLVTPRGWEYNAASFVKIGGRYYDTDDLTPERRADVRRAEALRRAENARFTVERGVAGLSWQLDGRTESLRFRLRDGRIL